MSSPIIFHITPSLEQGGAQTQLLLLCKSNPKNNVVFSLIPNGALLDQFSHAGIDVYESSNRFLLLRLVQLLLVLNRLRPHLVIGWMYHGCVLSLLAKLIFRRRIFWNIRHSLVSLRYESWYTKLSIVLCRLTSSLPDKIIFNSRISRSQHVTLGFNPDHTTVISNGISLSRFKPSPLIRTRMRSKLNIPDDLFVIGHVARFHPMKNHLGLLASLSQLKQSGRKFACVLVGTNINNKQVVNSIRQHNLCDNVYLLDRSELIHDFYPCFDLFVLPSLWGEAFPNVIGEAMASGVPVISSDLGDASYIIGDTGFTYPAGNHEAFLTKLIYAFDNRSLLREYQFSSRQRILTYFSLDSMLSSYTDLIGF